MEPAIPQLDIYKDENFRQQVRAALTRDSIERSVRMWQMIDIATFGLEYNPIQTLNEEFPFLGSILAKFGDKIAVCGGAVANAVMNYFDPSATKDVDIFFYGVSQNEATSILIDCVATLISGIPFVGYDPDGEDEDRILAARIERSENCTNVSFRLLPRRGHRVVVVYQFIHRIYPTFDSIIGGFDIPLSRFAYDGHRIYCTALAAFCREKKVIVADITRRSPSFEHRLVKYARRFGMLLYFPGLDHEQLFFKKQHSANLTNLQLTELQTKLKEFGLKLRYPGSKRACRTPEIELSAIRRAVEAITYSNTNPRPPFFFRRIVFWNNGVSMSKMPSAHTSNTKEYIYEKHDYGGALVSDDLIKKINTNMIAINKLDSVVSTRVFRKEATFAQVEAKFKKDIRSPKIWTDPELNNYIHRDTCHSDVQEQRGWHHDENLKIRSLTRTFEAAVVIFDDRVSKAYDRLIGIKWNDQDPERQWTSSFNPTPLSAPQFYGNYYKRFEVGVPTEVAACLILARRCGSIFSWLPKDVFNYLMRWLYVSYSSE